MKAHNYIHHIRCVAKGYRNSIHKFLILLSEEFYWSGIRDYIVVNCWVRQHHGITLPHNFGDDINIPVIEFLSGKRVRALNTKLRRNVRNYICIGSMIDTESNSKSIVWGGGVLYGNSDFYKAPPGSVLAVRGPKSRNYLLSKGINCPEVYGDPALLLPLVYHSIAKKRFRMGIIPHYLDSDNELIKEFIADHTTNACLINLSSYSNWQSVVDMICSCEFVVSSSLHGMIVADAYGIPNIQVKFSDLINGGQFKYMDYSMGVGRTYYEPLDLSKDINIKQIENGIKKYVPISYDYRKLIGSCPFKLPTKTIQYIVQGAGALESNS